MQTAGLLGMAQGGSDAGWVCEPFLHAAPGGLFNPLTGLTLAAADPAFGELCRLRDGQGTAAALADERRARLAAEGWLVRAGEDLAARCRLTFVTLETHTLCNQSCDFCPVARARRPKRWMPDALFDSIVAQLAEYRGTIRGVFLSQYNEPTLDPRLSERLSGLAARGLPAALNTNGTNLSPELVDAIVAQGGIAFLSVNLTTLEPERYAAERGSGMLRRVLQNLDYAGARPVAERMEIAVLGDEPAAHDRAVAQIARRFAGTRFAVRRFSLCDRAGSVARGVHLAAAPRRLAGCEQTGSRPLQHLHVTASGRCVLCCQDYGENYVCGDLGAESVRAVLGGTALRRLRRWAYGLEQAPADFICRRCAFALTVPSAAP